MPQLVITAVGRDRPGLVDALAGRLLDAGANVADSRMVNLRGQFALILLIEAPDNVIHELSNTLVETGRELGLVVNVPPQAKAEFVPRDAIPFRLRAFAMDQPGIVHRITHLLNHHGANIEELQTRLEPGSYTGTPLFTMELRMTVPSAVPVRVLRQQLEELCDSLNCDVELKPG